MPKRSSSASDFSRIESEGEGRNGGGEGGEGGERIDLRKIHVGKTSSGTGNATELQRRPEKMLGFLHEKKRIPSFTWDRADAREQVNAGPRGHQKKTLPLPAQAVIALAPRTQERPVGSDSNMGVCFKGWTPKMVFLLRLPLKPPKKDLEASKTGKPIWLGFKVSDPEERVLKIGLGPVKMVQMGHRLVSPHQPKAWACWLPLNQSGWLTPPKKKRKRRTGAQNRNRPKPPQTESREPRAACPPCSPRPPHRRGTGRCRCRRCDATG